MGRAAVAAEAGSGAQRVNLVAVDRIEREPAVFLWERSAAGLHGASGIEHAELTGEVRVTRDLK